MAIKIYFVTEFSTNPPRAFFEFLQMTAKKLKTMEPFESTREGNLCITLRILPLILFAAGSQLLHDTVNPFKNYSASITVDG